MCLETPADVCYSIHSKSIGATVDIIKHVSGSCRSGRLLALMGHSGAGKTTLVSLDHDLSKLGDHTSLFGSVLFPPDCAA